MAALPKDKSNPAKSNQFLRSLVETQSKCKCLISFKKSIGTSHSYSFTCKDSVNSKFGERLQFYVSQLIFQCSISQRFGESIAFFYSLTADLQVSSFHHLPICHRLLNFPDLMSYLRRETLKFFVTSCFITK